MEYLKSLLPLLGNRIIVLDGGFATQLEKEGEDLQDLLWSAAVIPRNPQLIKKIHLDYLRAGSDIITTCSYQATIEGFQKKGFTEEQAERLIESSCLLAKEARDEFFKETKVKCLVAGSIGCFGASLANGSEYHGNYSDSMTIEQLQQFHRKRMSIIIGTGVDLLALETIPSKLEAEALIGLLSEFPECHAWLSFNCRDSKHTCHGELFSECYEMVSKCPQIIAIGMNCVSPKHVSGLLSSVPSHLRRIPICVYPNSGEEWDYENRCWKEDKRDIGFGSLIFQWQHLGAQLIGGCCRTTPEDIKRIASLIKNSSK